MKKNKKIVIVITIIVSIIMTYGIAKIFITKKEDKEIIKEVKKEKTFAIMIQSGDTYKEYTSKDNKWPDDNYIFSKAECIDNGGNKIEDAITFNNETRKATLKSKKTIYCTLYFDESNIIKLRENEKLLNKNNLSPEPNQGGMYRYQGTDDVANWICFGTTDNCGTNDDLIDKYMYRIIGITPNGELYLLKETFLKEGDVTGFAWNDEGYIDSRVESCLGGICPEWNEANLFQRINGIANGTKTGNGNANDGVDNDTDIFIDSEYYDYLKSGDNDKINGSTTASEWYNLIADHEWMYGDAIYGDAIVDIRTDMYNGDYMYAIETGQAETLHYVQIPEGSTIVESQNYKWPETNKVKSKISLMYLHDVDYAYPGGNPNNRDNVKNSWIHFQKDGYNSSPSYEWLSTRYGIYSTDNPGVSAWNIANHGGANYGDTNLDYANGVRPVFYLSPKTKIISGTGTKNSPFILDI